MSRDDALDGGSDKPHCDQVVSGLVVLSIDEQIQVGGPGNVFEYLDHGARGLPLGSRQTPTSPGAVPPPTRRRPVPRQLWGTTDAATSAMANV